MEPGPAELPLAAVLPGLALGLLVAGLTVAGSPLVQSGAIGEVGLAFALLPWLALLASRQSAATIGLTRERIPWGLAWGALVGALWRGASMLFNAWGVGAWPGAVLADLVSDVLLWPFVEEVFFRGYLGLGLRPVVGRWPAIVVQALLFLAMPWHWAQGPRAWLSILAFGLLAGYLTSAKRSLWPAMGAHWFANLMPKVLLVLA